MANFSPINPIQNIKIPEIPGQESISKKLQVTTPPDKTNQNPSFSKILGDFFQDVGNMQKNAEQSVQKLATGEITDVHQVMVAMSEADVAFKLMMEIRNKLVGAYKEILKTPL